MDVGMYSFEFKQMREEEERVEQAMEMEQRWSESPGRSGLVEESGFGESFAAGARTSSEFNCQLSQNQWKGFQCISCSAVLSGSL